ncbi:hypothetical protein NDU88_000472 [Pleurodeles waltl]|uniref:Uncharacterized protein n=1 Tax=Pleurodeles waltl TaxID=8319 RepID=A0AAV7NBZ8_PLEWA|nr:hypothetical protein NDU88_000472 [Pleurodeles waltl]
MFTLARHEHRVSSGRHGMDKGPGGGARLRPCRLLLAPATGWSSISSVLRLNEKDSSSTTHGPRPTRETIPQHTIRWRVMKKI